MAVGGDLGGSGTVTTADESDTSLVQAHLPENSAGNIKLMVVAREVLSGKSRSWIVYMSLKRDAADVIVTNVTASHSSGDRGTNQWSVDIQANGDNANVIVNGQASSEIDWFGEISGIVVSH